MIYTYLAIDKNNQIWKEHKKEIPEIWGFIKKCWENEGYLIIEDSNSKSDFNNIESCKLNCLNALIKITDYDGKRYYNKEMAQHTMPFDEFWSQLN